LFDKSEEDVSSAGEQLASNKIYDGENTEKAFPTERSFHCDVFIVENGLKNSFLKLYQQLIINEQKSIKTTFY